MTSPLSPRFRIALGGIARIGEERPAIGGVRWFEAHVPGDVGRPAHRAVLCPPPPEGPIPKLMGEFVRTLQRLAHPALAAVHEVGEFEGRTWFIERWPTAPTIADRLETRGVISSRETIITLRELARGLAVLHREGVAHGRISVETVHLGIDGDVVVDTGWEVGTAASDLHALGALGWMMLTGEDPVTPDPERLARRRPGVPAELAALLTRLLHSDTSQRPGRAEDVLAALDAFPSGEPEGMGELFEGAGRGARAGERHPWVVVAALVALVGLLYVLFARAP